MNYSTALAMSIVASSLSSLATEFYIEPIAYQAGYAQAEALANWVMAPTTLEEAEAEKHLCEKGSKETCYISGGFWPESMTIEGQDSEPSSDAAKADSI